MNQRDRLLYLVSCLLWLAVDTASADLDAGLDAVRKKDYAAAKIEFEIGAEKGDADAQVNLGNLYMKGWGVSQNYAAAYDWYAKAAQQNSRIAQSKLGILHYYGLGTIQDSAEAVKWFERAAEQGEPSAQSVLGVLYAQGDGVPRNLVKSFFWLTLAFEFGDADAENLRAQVSEEMTPGELADALGKVDDWKRDKDIPDPGGAPNASAELSLQPEPSQGGAGTPAQNNAATGRPKPSPRKHRKSP